MEYKPPSGKPSLLSENASLEEKAAYRLGCLTGNYVTNTTILVLRQQLQAVMGERDELRALARRQRAFVFKQFNDMATSFGRRAEEVLDQLALEDIR